MTDSSPPSVDLTSEGSWRQEAKATLALAGPLALANLLQMLTYAVDVVFIARLGAEELAASALVVAIFGLLLWTTQSLVAAVAPIIAAELGAHGPALRVVRRAMRMAMWLSVMLGIGAMAVCFAAVPFMLLTGQDPRIVALAGDFMAVLMWAAIPMVLTGALRSFVSALGRPFFATAITALGIGVNVLGNYMLVFGNWGAPALGLTGSALATVITALVVLACYVAAIFADRRLARYRIFGRLWRPDWVRMAEILRIGTPIALTVLAEAGVFGAAAFLMGRIGALELAAHTLALQIASLAFQVPHGVGQAATIRVGWFYGAADRAGMARAGWTGIALGTGFMAITALAMLIVPHWLLAIYIDPADPANAALVRVAVTFLMVAAAFQLFDGLQAVAAGALRGLQDTRVPLFIALFSYWVPGFGLALGLGFATRLAGIGVWIGLAAGLVCAALLLVRRWARREAMGLTAEKNLAAGG